MLRSKLGPALALLVVLQPIASPCTVFLAAREGVVLAGNNEDYTDKDTRVWFHPAAEHSFGRVYFGFGNGFPQGGMNDHGLFFDGLALENKIEAAPGRESFEGNLIDKAMQECSTVAEVVALFERYDFPALASGQLFVGDATGDAAILERQSIIRKRDANLVATNFNQSMIPPEKATCPRYRKANEMLQAAPDLTVDLIHDVLDAVHQGSTVYSNVYDLVHRDVFLFLSHDFATVVQFNLDEELKKGERELRLPEYFAELQRQQDAGQAR
jgi:hypothetical protein